MHLPQVSVVEDTFLYVGQLTDNAVHQHYNLQLSLALDQPFELQIQEGGKNKYLRASGVLLDGQVPHALLDTGGNNVVTLDTSSF